MKSLGYNTVRKHIKTEPDQFYYDCDRLGMIVLQDMYQLTKKGLSGAVYTQISGVEDETNGLLTYDRKVLKVKSQELRTLMDRISQTAD